MPTAVLDVELFRPLCDVKVPPRYDSALALLRWRGKPIARVRLELSGHSIDPMALWRAVQEEVGASLCSKLLPDLVHEGVRPPRSTAAGPACTVVICTRNRADDLRKCLTSVCASARDGDEVLVVDNAPSDNTTAEAAKAFAVRYEREDRKGLNWARAHGIRSARREIVAFTDDDVTVDAAWVAGMAEPFLDPGVSGVTGLIMPAELETRAQELFEVYGGFAGYFERRWFNASNLPPVAAGQVGAGASMAFRRKTALDLALFDCEMDCGTASRSGGDHYAFYRALRAGHTLVFNPEAICWHRHRRTERELLTTLHGYSVGVYSFLLRCLLQHRDRTAIGTGLEWFVGHHLRDVWRGLLRKPGALPLRYTLHEIRGACAAPWAYRSIRRAECAYPATGRSGGRR